MDICNMDFRNIVRELPVYTKYKDLEGEKIKKYIHSESLYDTKAVFICESGKRVFVGGWTPAWIYLNDFWINSGVFTDKEISRYFENKERKEAESKKRLCEQKRRKLEQLKKELGEC